MKRIMMISAIASAVVLIAASIPSQANDAHHPEKTAKTKTSTGSKVKPAKKKAPVKSNKTGASAGNG